MIRLLFKILKLIGKIVGGIAVLAIVAVGGLNVAKFAIYSEFYGMEESLCVNPGLNDGFVCQGIAAWDYQDIIVVSGYMKDGGCSRIYMVNPDTDDEIYFNLVSNGEPFDGHCGGIAIYDDTAIIASEGKLFTFDLYYLFEAGYNEGEFIDIGEGYEVPTAASFVYCDEQYLYVGEFHDGENYVTEHYYNTNEGDHYAIIVRYDVWEFLYNYENVEVEMVYSIRNKVQGACFTPEGQIIFSTSYGLADTVYYVYNESELTDSGEYFMGAPVMFVDNCAREIKGPAMGEDLDYYNGKVITMTESASDKYLFGKLFFANKISALSF